jgi:hypothetical protein
LALSQFFLTSFPLLFAAELPYHVSPGHCWFRLSIIDDLTTVAVSFSVAVIELSVLP